MLEYLIWDEKTKAQDDFDKIFAFDLKENHDWSAHSDFPICITRQMNVRQVQQQCALTIQYFTETESWNLIKIILCFDFSISKQIFWQRNMLRHFNVMDQRQLNAESSIYFHWSSLQFM